MLSPLLIMSGCCLAVIFFGRQHRFQLGLIHNLILTVSILCAVLYVQLIELKSKQLGDCVQDGYLSDVAFLISIYSLSFTVLFLIFSAALVHTKYASPSRDYLFAAL